MPTQRARTHITHTPQVEEALRIARVRWSDIDRDSSLLLLLVEEGARAVARGEREGDEQRVARLRKIAGKRPGLYVVDYLDDVRAGWAE